MTKTHADLVAELVAQGHSKRKAETMAGLLEKYSPDEPEAVLAKRARKLMKLFPNTFTTYEKARKAAPDWTD